MKRFSNSESSIFLQWVWLASDSIGATPTRQPSLKGFGLDRLAGQLYIRPLFVAYQKLSLNCKWSLPLNYMSATKRVQLSFNI